MSRGYYASTRATSLSSGVTSGAVDLPVTDGITFPDPDAPGNMEYTIIVGYGSDREEVCTVTSKPTADTLRVTRGEDGTSATAKNVGDVVVHGVSARDFTEPKTPAAHAASHASGGSDPLAPLAPAGHAATHAAAGTDPLTLAQSQVTGLTAALGAIGDWQAWSPALVQPGAIARTVNYGGYGVIGDLVVCAAYITAGGNGAAGQIIAVTLPVTPAAGVPLVMGAAAFTRPGVVQYRWTAVLVGSSVGFLPETALATPGYAGVVDGVTITSGDVVSLVIIYPKAA